MITEGKKAPNFALESDSGEKVRLSQFLGEHNVVLYFYPKDDTPGCTKEACAFHDARAKIARAGAVVLGVSPDSPERHTKFKEKYKLGFTLLADPDHAVAEKYGAWGEKTLYGKKSMGIIRSTFLIDKTGVVRKVWPKVKVDGHDEAVLAALKELG